MRQAAKEKRRRKVAAGIVAGTPTSEVAKAAECSERQVERIAAERETKILVTRLLAPHRARLEALAEKSIGAIELALDAKKIGDDADHMVRLRAVGRAAELLKLAQGTEPEPEPERGLVTWEEFLLIHRTRTERPNA